MTLLREALLAAGAFGDPTAMTRKELLENAYLQFKDWRRENRIPCSQRRFTEKALVKQCHGFYLTTKAYNARVVAQWLAYVLSVQSEMARDVSDSKLPVHALALLLGLF